MKRSIVTLLLLSLSGCSWICSTPSALDTEYRDVNRDLRQHLVTVIQRAPAAVTEDELTVILYLVESAEDYEAVVWGEDSDQ